MLLAGCSGAGKAPQRSEIDSAIALFVSGQYEQAIEHLDQLAETLQSEESLREVYYYLGRTHLALGQNNRAIDAFSAGVNYGDTGGSLDYLEQLRVFVEGRESSVRRSETVTRRQLASAMVRRFLLAGEGNEPAVGDPGAALEEVIARGWMQRLPDGALHGEDAVTRAALYVACARVSAQWGFGATVISGYRSTLASRGTETVTGAQVSDVLDDLAALRKQYGG